MSFDDQLLEEGPASSGKRGFRSTRKRSVSPKTSTSTLRSWVTGVKLFIGIMACIVTGAAVGSRWNRSRQGLDRDEKVSYVSAPEETGHDREGASFMHILHPEDRHRRSFLASVSLHEVGIMRGKNGDVVAKQNNEQVLYDSRENSWPLRERRQGDWDNALSETPSATGATAGDGEGKHSGRSSGREDSRFVPVEQDPSSTRENPVQLFGEPEGFVAPSWPRRGLDEAHDFFPGDNVIRRQAWPRDHVVRVKKQRKSRDNFQRTRVEIPSLLFEHRESPRRDPLSDQGNSTQSGMTGDGRASRQVTTGVSGHVSCSPRDIVGLERCPELEDAVDAMLDAKADMLRRILEVLSDPESAGIDGDPNKPLLLVQKLALDEADAVFSAFDREFVNVVTDAAGWNPHPGGFNRWVERYYNEVLNRTRPVIVSVHGDDVCALEQELSREARVVNSKIPNIGLADIVQTSRLMPIDHEDFTVPVVLMTLGWDPAGDPTHMEHALGRDHSCVLRVLEMKRIVRWFTSHTRYDSHTDKLFDYLPIGFGGFDTRNQLSHTAYVDAARRQLEILESCPANMNGRYDLLFQCNTLEREPRGEIFRLMTQKTSGPVPVNRAPLEPREMVIAAAKGIFAVSPPGTGYDCFRHYEMMLEGNIVLVHDTYSLRSFMKGLPAFFFGRLDGWKWGSLTCKRLLEMATAVQTALREGKGKDGNGQGGMQFEKLTHGFWRRYIRRKTLLAGGAEESAPYVERSTVPLNEHGWKTFRRIGCFSRKKEFRLSRGKRDVMIPLGEEERNPEGCAAHCSLEPGGGVGFFGIHDGRFCWCDASPGHRAVPEAECNIDCKNGDGQRGCGGPERSMSYVFGPEEKGAPFRYLGCFPKNYHLMFHAKTRLRRSNTPFVCEAFCTSLRYPFFALENAEWCHCGVIPSNTPRSVQIPAYLPDRGYKPNLLPPNGSHAAEPEPRDVRVGDTRFSCHQKRCSGNTLLWGCGGKSAVDLYMNLEPCVLFRDCEHST